MIRSILKSIYDRAKSIVLMSVLALILLPGCYTTWGVIPYDPAYPPSTVVIVDGGSYWYGGGWWYGYHGMWYRHRISIWQPYHNHEYQVTPRHERVAQHSMRQGNRR